MKKYDATYCFTFHHPSGVKVYVPMLHAYSISREVCRIRRFQWKTKRAVSILKKIIWLSLESKACAIDKEKKKGELLDKATHLAITAVSEYESISDPLLFAKFEAETEDSIRPEQLPYQNQKEVSPFYSSDK